MKITIFGSTGPLGMELIKQALHAGYFVIAYARNSEKLSRLQNEKLQIIEGDLTNRKEIERAVAGVDAVISVLGPKGKVKNTELSEGVKMIVESMEKMGTKRLIALGTGSIKDPQDRFDFTYSLLVTMIKTTVKTAYQEIVRIGEIIRSSKFDWTLVRVGFLNNDQALPLKVGYYGHREVRVKISRASIAKFMLDQVTSSKNVRESPAISN